MRLKLFAGALLVLLSVRCLNAFILARDIAGPRTRTWEIVRRAVHPSFEIKVPNRNFIARVRFSLVPEAAACGAGTCTGTTSKATCQGGALTEPVDIAPTA